MFLFFSFLSFNLNSKLKTASYSIISDSNKMLFTSLGSGLFESPSICTVQGGGSGAGSCSSYHWMKGVVHPGQVASIERRPFTPTANVDSSVKLINMSVGGSASIRRDNNRQTSQLASGFKPRAFILWGERANHYTTKPPFLFFLVRKNNLTTQSK